MHFGTEDYIEKNKESFPEGVYESLIKSVGAIEKINMEICKDPAIGRDRQIGHSFLFKVRNIGELTLMWKHEIFPLLEEYCYGDYKKINKIVFNKDSNTKWIDESKGIMDIDDINEMLDEVIV